MKKTKLKKLEVNSVDLVPAGANPDAHINLFKSKEDRPAWGRIVEAVKKTFGMDEADLEAVVKEHYNPACNQCIDNEVWDYTSAFRESCMSILKDAGLDADGKAEMLQKSTAEFTEAMDAVIPLWSKGQEALQKSLDDETVEKYKQLEIEALEERLAILKADGEEPDEPEEPENDDEPENEPEQGEDEIDMKIDKSKLNAAEQAQLESLIAKSAVEETVDTPVEKGNTEEVEKMNSRIAELETALAMKEMEEVAKGYEILGKDKVELAKSLFNMKQAGEEAYNEYVAMLDIAKAGRENSGLFTEVGKSRTETVGGAQQKAEAIASELMKSDPTLTRVQAIAKAWEQNPDLVKEYDKEAN